MKRVAIIKFLGDLSSLYNKTGDNRRAGSFARASQSIQLHIKDEEVEDLNSLQQLPNVGGSTVKELIEFDKNGTTERMKSLEKTLEDMEPPDTSSKMASAMDKINAIKARMGKK